MPHPSGERLLGLDTVGGGRPVTDAERKWVRGRYDDAVAFADAEVGRLLQALGGRTDVLVILVGDHGEDLLDHGFLNHRHGVYESSTHVPLVVAGPGFAPGRIDTPVSTRGVYATVLAASGIPRPGGVGPAFQRLAAGFGAEDLVFSEGVAGQLAVRSGSDRLHLAGLPRDGSADGPALAGAKVALYDLAADPEERTDRALAEPERVARLRQQAITARQALPKGPAPAVPVVAPWVRAELRRSGYW